MWNIFKRPVEPRSVEAWAKITDDLMKVAIVAVSAMLYDDKYSLTFKVVNFFLLLLIIYVCFALGRYLRQFKSSN